MATAIIMDISTNISYIFDILFDETHDNENTITQNPVQTGAPVNDQVYRQPNLYTLNIGTSDCMSSVIPGQFSSDSSRSASAVDLLQGWQQNAQQLTILTSIGPVYNNMVIRSLTVTRDATTQTAMKATVVFQEVIMATANIVSISALPQISANSSDPQVTGSTNSGTVQAQNAHNKVLKIPGIAYGNSTAKYNGNTISLSSYFSKYAPNTKIVESVGFLPSYQITLNISMSVALSTTFTVDGAAMSYTQFVKKYQS